MTIFPLISNPGIWIEADAPLAEQGRIKRVSLLAGSLTLRHDASIMPFGMYQTSVLAAFGASNIQIGAISARSPTTIKTQMETAAKRHNIAGRTAFSRLYLKLGLFALETESEPLKISTTQTTVLDLAADGASNSEIAAAMNRSKETVKGHLERMSQNNALYGRESLISAALMSGQIGYERTIPDLEYISGQQA